MKMTLEEMGKMSYEIAISKTDEERIAFAKALDVNDYRTIPGYWKEHLADRIATIHQRQIEAGIDSTSFALMGDFHFTTNCLRSPALVEEVLRECSIPYFIQGGDVVSGMGVTAPENIIREMECVRRLFSSVESKMLMAIGNHDPAYSTFPGQGYAESLDVKQLYEYMFRHQSQYPNRVFSDAGLYFYADDTCHKMRYIILNSHDTPNDNIKEDGKPEYPKMKNTGFCQTQLEWFANVALNVPSPDWTVVICSHEPCRIDGEDYHHNRHLVLGIVDAFRKHTSFSGASTTEEDPGYYAEISVDYTGAGGNFAAWVGGHYHQGAGEYDNGILCLSPFSDGFHYPGNTDEQSFEVVTVDKKNHRLNITCIGFGEDRSFSYEVF